MYQTAETTTSVSSITMYAIDLPSSYSGDEYRVGFVNNYAGIITRKFGVWWMSVISLTDGSLVWSKTRTTITSTRCFSCAIRGFDDYFVVGTLNEADANHDIMYMEAATGTVNFRAEISADNYDPTSGNANLNNCPIEAIYGIKNTSGGFRIGFLS